MTALIYLVYYLLPEELVPGFFKWHGLLVIMTIALAIEVIRLKFGKLIFGMREYERKQISAYAWFTMGMGLALLFFNMIFVVPTVIGMATIDPLIGELRHGKKKYCLAVSSILFAIIMFSCLFLLSEKALWIVVLFTVVGTISALYSESWVIKGIDDDFLMIIVPLMVLTVLDLLISSL
jgi:hypothetical protein